MGNQANLPSQKGTMIQKLKNFFASWFEIQPEERLKVGLLCVTFGLIVGSYTVALELKSSVFLQIVGLEYIPTARIVSMVLLIPLIMFYSRLVDKIRRYQLVYFYTIAYGVMGLIFAYFLSHPVIGLPNTELNANRIFGWLFYFYVEGYAPFVVSVFWAFVNSINTPDSAKKHYALIAAASKFGSMITSAIAWLLLSPLQFGKTLCSDTVNIQLLLVFASLLLMIAPIMIYLLITRVPRKMLHGYEAVYQFERKKVEAEKKSNLFSSVWGGIMMFIRQPYVLGIFCMVFFYDTVYVVFSYLRLAVLKAESANVSDMTCGMFKQIFVVHTIGLLIALIGTQTLLSKLGERLCLLLIPIISGSVLLYVLVGYNSASIFVGFVVLRALNYGFTQPVKESLYVPTVKDLKFKSKSWIDAFGSKLAKSTGSGFNELAKWAGPVWFMPLHSALFVSVVGAWVIAAFLLGKRYEKAIANNEVIGEVVAGEEELVA